MKAIAIVLLALLAACAPAQRRPAPVEDRRPPERIFVPPADAAAPEGFYVVKKGDTLYSIALEHGHDYRELAQWNSLDDPTRINAGQMLRVAPPPQPQAQLKEPAIVVGQSRAGSRIESRAIASPVLESKPAPVLPSSLPREEPKLEAGPLQFTWPVKGKVVAGFAEPRQKGIDIAGKTGEAVTASAGGRVTYVGSGIPGLGKLIVIKHDQGFITVYAHNRDILVKEQQTVSRGQKIAELGEKLHFQIRKGAAVVDPLLYLPRS